MTGIAAQACTEEREFKRQAAVPARDEPTVMREAVDRLGEHQYFLHSSIKTIQAQKVTIGKLLLFVMKFIWGRCVCVRDRDKIN